MEMRAIEDIAIAQDLTPPLPPLSFSLYDSSLSSHCSSCFHSLPTTTTTTTTTTSTFLCYCSNGVCSASSSLHFSSAEHHLFLLLHHHPSLFPHHDSSDLRSALRLLHHHLHRFLSPPPHRLFGLLTNRRKLLSHDARVRDGARVMAMARALRDGRDFDFGDSDYDIEEAVLSLVITNAVEINVHSEGSIGIGVYDWRFSWINHSCSPNLCYRFVDAFDEGLQSGNREESMRIEPHGGEITEVMDWAGCEMAEGNGNYGPRIIVRSIKGIRKGEEVKSTYTDLLQPTALRQSELLKYQFICDCKRCRAVPQSYVDQALQEIFVAHDPNNSLRSPSNLDVEKAVESLKDVFDSIIAEYMEVGNPESCCDKIEGLLCRDLYNPHLEQMRGVSHMHFQFSPPHHLSLNAYTTLYSTYKIRSLFPSIGGGRFCSFNMSRISAAYSLLLAGATHHLFQYEPSLIASAATFWLNTGESLLYSAKNSCNIIAKCMSQNISSTSNLKCSGCSLMDMFETNYSSTQTQLSDFDNISRKFLICISITIPKVWGFLVHGCQYLEDVKDPVDFSWLGDLRTNGMMDRQFHISEGSWGIKDPVKCDEEEPTNEMRTNVLRLGIHCLLYGYYLSCICYGHQSPSIQNILYSEYGTLLRLSLFYEKQVF